jgi:hypothetical protein
MFAAALYRLMIRRIPAAIASRPWIVPMPLKLTPSTESPVSNNQIANRSIPKFLSSFNVFPSRKRGWSRVLERHYGR